MVDKALRLKRGVLTKIFIFINSMGSSPGSKTTCRRTYSTCSINILLEMKSIVDSFKMRQCLNIILQRIVYLNSGVSVLLGSFSLSEEGSSLEPSNFTLKVDSWT